jgi:hypothetical protein
MPGSLPVSETFFSIVWTVALVVIGWLFQQEK